MRPCLVLLLSLVVFPSAVLAGPKALFDIFHGQMAGNADWVIDDNWPIPLPPQSGINPGTPLTYWSGAISSWGVSLVKRGYTVHTNISPLTYGSTSNPYDLSHYDVLIVDEPNNLFSSSEATAIFDFVANGGGLVAVSDHANSDRDHDGWDSPMIWNALDPGHRFGVRAASLGEANSNISQYSYNVNFYTPDSVIFGPAGFAYGLAFFNGTTFTLYPGINPSVHGDVWIGAAAPLSTSGVMAASSVYGNGRVFFLGDSSPCDDGTGSGGRATFPDWGLVGDSTLVLNATLWATRRLDVAPPAVQLNAPNGGQLLRAGGTSAITWTATDNVGVTGVDLAYSVDGGETFPFEIARGVENTGDYIWSVPDTPSGIVRVRVTASDAAGNTAVDISDENLRIDHFVIAAFAGAGGTITPGGSVPALQGGTTRFTIAPAPEHRIADVTVDGVSVGPVAEWTFSDIRAGHSIVASFAPREVAAVGAELPRDFEIESVWPNPARGAVTIGLAAPRSTNAQVGIVDLQGREVAHLFEGTLEAGRRTLRWNTGAERGKLPAGLYWVRFTSPGVSRMRMIVLVK